ncbi:hypothetical protein LTR36_008301 [Oleoguttula mirabilis]|uniref:Conserved oligomeric Golgi complex subunit 2 n=1 Tax=Oleoguttula mirabilis TaxID=1507867 RepID=A0AAV9J8A7_9PEZI|nr:hypothetical protein LTR36_008301 [Oleoguttula mirabilis]
MSNFHISSSTSTPAYSYPASSTTTTAEHSSDDEDTLPYPTELPRTDFLAANFDPQTYLSSLRNRHQTLEDLRSDLRQRSQLLSKELLDLVNGDYEEFLSLGGDLRGGEEKVEGVRVGVLGFRREVEGVRAAVGERAREVGGLVAERKGLRGNVGVGRALVEVDARVGELEESLGVTGKEDEEGSEGEDSDLEDDDDDGAEGLSSSAEGAAITRLQRHAQHFIFTTRLIARLEPHPFLAAQRPRLAELRKTLLLDLAAALRQAKARKDPDVLLKLIRIYGDLGAEDQAIRVLKG